MSVVQTVVNAVHQVAAPLVHTVLPNAPLRKYGVHPLMWQILQEIGIPASRCGQAIGHAAASVGTHVKTGVYDGADYSPCLDFHVTDLSHADALTYIVTPLAARGCPAFLRVPGADGWPAADAYHVHAIYPGCNLTPIVAHQVMDWLSVPTRNGLARHQPFEAYKASPSDREACKALFAEHKIVIV